MRTVLQIQSHFGDYPVMQAGSLDEALITVCHNEKAWLIFDQALDSSCGEVIKTHFDTDKVLSVVAHEESKTFESLSPILHWLLESGFRRDAVLIAVGGGVIQDIAAFIASILFRGIRWKLIPSTLLAQCDSCIGSKSSINFSHYKNQLGTFYPPLQVILVPQLLDTLSQEAILSGLGEIIKLHLIAGPDEFLKLREQLAKLKIIETSQQSSSQTVLQGLIQSSLHIKKTFIEEDEFDRGIRNLLNYGHSFGHAYEAVTDFAIPHGIAISLGMATATWFSASIGWLDQKQSSELIHWLKPYFIPYQEKLEAVSASHILQVMLHDKKNVGQEVSCILTRGAGKMEKTSLNADRTLELLAGWLKELTVICAPAS